MVLFSVGQASSPFLNVPEWGIFIQKQYCRETHSKAIILEAREPHVVWSFFLFFFKTLVSQSMGRSITLDPGFGALHLEKDAQKIS